MHFHKFSFKDIIFRLHLGLFYRLHNYTFYKNVLHHNGICLFSFYVDSLTSLEFCCYCHRKTFITVHTASHLETSVKLEIVTGFNIFLSYMYSYTSKLISANSILHESTKLPWHEMCTLCIIFSFHSLVFFVLVYIVKKW